MNRTLAEHDDVAVVDSHGRYYTLAMDAPNGREVTIPFNVVEVNERSISLYKQSARQTSREHVGSLDGGAEQWGALGEWFVEHDPTYGTEQTNNVTITGP